MTQFHNIKKKGEKCCQVVELIWFNQEWYWILPSRIQKPSNKFDYLVNSIYKVIGNYIETCLLVSELKRPECTYIQTRNYIDMYACLHIRHFMHVIPHSHVWSKSMLCWTKSMPVDQQCLVHQLIYACLIKTPVITPPPF